MIYNKRGLVVVLHLQPRHYKNFKLSDMTDYYSNIIGNIALKINLTYEFLVVSIISDNIERY